MPHDAVSKRTGVLRVAAVGDVHVGLDGASTLLPHLEAVRSQADLLLLAGDLTRNGDPAEAAVLAGELDGIGVRVLGNHDLHLDRGDELRAVGVTVLEGDGTTVELDGGASAWPAPRGSAAGSPAPWPASSANRG